MVEDLILEWTRLSYKSSGNSGSREGMAGGMKAADRSVLGIVCLPPRVDIFGLPF